MKRALSMIVLTMTGMLLAGSTWAADYGTGYDEKAKEIQEKATDQPKSMMENQKEETQEKIQKQERQIEQKGEDTMKMQEKGKEMMPSNMDEMMKNK